MMKWYGSLNNRIEEGRQFVEEIKVGTGMTKYGYSDRDAYEVTEVQDQKHVTVREYDHKHVGDGCMDNSWELVSNPENPEYELVKRGKFWYNPCTLTRDDVEAAEGDWERMLRFALAGFDTEQVKAKGKQTKYFKWNVSFGTASYYYDYEF